MAVTIVTPTNSFVRFDGTGLFNHCKWGEQDFCLPVVSEDDVAFQFIVLGDTVEEIDDLCDPLTSGLQIGLVADCEQAEFDIEFTETPERYRISPLQILYNWPHGFPGMIGTYSENDCFSVRVIVGGVQACSNCFSRMVSDCFTSVIEYGNDENFAGFNYCNAGEAIADSATCEPYVVNFTDRSTLIIPYTAGLQSQFGEVPTVQAWIFDPMGVPTNMGISITFDGLPPTLINLDFGGPASGSVIIK